MESKPYDAEAIAEVQQKLAPQVKATLQNKKCMDLSGLSELECLIKLVEYIEKPDRNRRRKLEDYRN